MVVKLFMNIEFHYFILSRRYYL